MLMLFDGINNIHEVNLCNAKSLKSDALDNELINVFFFKVIFQDSFIWFESFVSGLCLLVINNSSFCFNVSEYDRSLYNEIQLN